MLKKKEISELVRAKAFFCAIDFRNLVMNRICSTSRIPTPRMMKAE